MEVADRRERHDTDIDGRQTGATTPNTKRSAQRLRGLFRALLAITVTLVAVIGATAGFLLSLPVSAASGSAVATTLAEHHSRPSSVPVPAKLAAAVMAGEDEHVYANIAVDVPDGAERAAVAAF